MSDQPEDEEIIAWYTEDPGGPITHGTWADYRDFLLARKSTSWRSTSWTPLDPTIRDE